MIAEPIMSLSASGSNAFPSSETWSRRRARYPSIQSVLAIRKMRSAANPYRSSPSNTYQKYGMPKSRTNETAFGIVNASSQKPWARFASPSSVIGSRSWVRWNLRDGPPNTDDR